MSFIGTNNMNKLIALYKFKHNLSVTTSTNSSGWVTVLNISGNKGFASIFVSSLITFTSSQALLRISIDGGAYATYYVRPDRSSNIVVNNIKFMTSLSIQIITYGTVPPHPVTSATIKYGYLT